MANVGRENVGFLTRNELFGSINFTYLKMFSVAGGLSILSSCCVWMRLILLGELK